MATSQDKGFMEQLREMRNTRTQQLRQGSQQAGLLNKQISAITTLNKTMDAVLRAQNVNNTSLRDFNKKQDALIRQNNSVTQGIRNLSSTIDKSIGSLAKSVTSTKASEVKEIKQSKGVIKEDSGSSMMSSLLMKALPFAITGVIGKTMVWDNMDESVKKGLTDSFGNLVKSIFGGIDTSGLKKVTDPITKEFGIVFGALGDTLESLTNKVSELVGIISKSVGGLTGANQPGGVGEAIDRAKLNAKVLETTGRKISSDIQGAVGTVAGLSDYVDSSYIGDAAKVVGATTAAVGATAIALGKGGQPQAPTTEAAAKTKPSMKPARKPRLMNPKELARMQEALGSLQKKGFKKPSVLQLLEELSLARISISSKAKEFFELAKTYKLTTAGSVIQLAFSLGLAYLVYREVDSLYENGVIDDTEKSQILSYLAGKETAMTVGGVLGGTLSGAGAGIIGGYATAASLGGLGAPALLGTIAAVGVGSYGGSKFGENIYESVISKPDVLTKDYTALQFAGASSTYNPVGTVNQSRKLDPGGRGKRQGALTPNSASQTASAMEIVGASEGGAAGYDAIFGYGGPGGDPSIPEKHGGKNLSQLTIGEVIAIGKSRGGNRGALGKYQFMPTVLEGLLSIAGLTKNDIFSPENQDHLYRVYTERNALELKKMGIEPTAENLLLYIKKILTSSLPTCVELSCLKLYETKDSYAEWCC